MQMSNLPFLYHGCALHSGVIKHASDTWSSTLPIRMNGGKAHGVSAPHSCTIAFTAAAAVLLKYVQISLLCLTANRSTLNGPISVLGDWISVCRVSSRWHLCDGILSHFLSLVSILLLSPCFVPDSAAISVGVSLTGPSHEYLPSCSGSYVTAVRLSIWIRTCLRDICLTAWGFGAKAYLHFFFLIFSTFTFGR